MTHLVLVTGGSGFIAGHCILRLLEAGYAVRATLRSLDREAQVRAVLTEAGMTEESQLSFVAADLTSDAGWDCATDGVNHVLHVASPVEPGHVRDESAVIEPARQGTLRVLTAARDAGVSRVVLTSAFHAVGWGHPHDDHVFTEADWTVIDGPGVDVYGRSKTLAEQAAWEFVAAEGWGMELTTMLPVAVMGPVLGLGISGANGIVKSMLDGSMPGLPNIFIPVVDVRDVAAAHVAAAESPEAAGQRFLLSNGPAMSLREIAAAIREHLGPDAARVPNRGLPDLLIRIGGLVNPQLREVRHDLGYARRTSNAKAREILGWVPRDPHEAVVAAAESLVRKGLVATKR